MDVATARQIVTYCSDQDGQVLAAYHGYTVRVGDRTGVLYFDSTYPVGTGKSHQVTVDFSSASFYGAASDACQDVVDRLSFQPLCS